MSQPWPQDPYTRRPVDINAYAPPRRGRAGWWLGIIAVILVGVVIGALLAKPTLTGTTTTPTPTPSTAQSAASGMPFTMPGSTESHGRWEILDHEWTTDGVIVHVQVSADSGRVSYGFVAFSNNGTDVYEPADNAPDPQIGTGSLDAGQSIDGYILLPLPAGDATLILTTALGRQISALPIPG